MRSHVPSRTTTVPAAGPSPTIRRGMARLRSGLSLAYAERGPVAPSALVLLHGLSDSWRCYEPLLLRLPASLRVIAVSQRGHGESDRPEQGYMLDDFARDVRDVLDERSVETALVAGHSLGASVAMRFGSDYPERALGLALLGAFASFRDNPGVLELAAQVSQLTDPVDREFVRDFQLATLARPIPAELLEQIVLESQALPARAWRAILAGLVGAEGMVAPSSIHMPALLLWGNRDAFVSRRDQQQLLAGLPQARLVEFADGGHAFHWEDPDACARELSAFAAALKLDIGASTAC